MHEQFKTVTDPSASRRSGNEAVDAAREKPLGLRDEIETWVNEGGAGDDVK